MGIIDCTTKLYIVYISRPSVTLLAIIVYSERFVCLPRHQWQRNRGNPGVDLFQELPVAFQAELSLETYKRVIEKVRWTQFCWREIELFSNELSLRLLLLHIDTCLLSCGTVLLFTAHSLKGVYNNNCMSYNATLASGSVCGANVLWKTFTFATISGKSTIMLWINLCLQSTLFRDAPEEFMRMLSLVAEQQLYLPSQIIINKGDISQHMFIITRGEAEVNAYTVKESHCEKWGECLH